MRRFLQLAGWLVSVPIILVGLFVVTLLSGEWVSPGPGTFIGIAAIVIEGFLPIVLCLTALHDPRTAARFGLPLAVLTFVPLLSVISRHYFRVTPGASTHWGVPIGPIALTLLFVAVPVTFWKCAARFGWPVPLQRSFWSITANHPFSSSFALVAVLVMVAVGSLSSVPWLPGIGECHGQPLLDESGVPRGADFTSRIIFVGPRPPFGILPGSSSMWCFARVQERFGRRSLKIPRYVILRGGFDAADQGREYFMESSVGGSDTLLGRLLPVIEPADCDRRAWLEHSGIWIRILREGAPKSGGRLIGHVYVGDPGVRRATRLAPSSSVVLEGANGTITAVADHNGIYDFANIPPGTYTAHATASEPDGHRSSRKAWVMLKTGEARDMDIYAQ